MRRSNKCGDGRVSNGVSRATPQRGWADRNAPQSFYNSGTNAQFVWRPKSARWHAGEGRDSRDLATPPLARRRGPSVPKLLADPYIPTTTRMTHSNQIPHDERTAVFSRSSISQSIYLLKLGKISRATEQNEQDSKDNDITDSCPGNVWIWTILYYTS